ncbi:MAG: hypothetical protein ACI9R3_003543 [Verrucomicrobiales bacterium]
MFSNSDVIEATRKFVCVRIESYESEENQQLVRSHLNGRFANTAFCILAPDGKERLTRSGRGPSQIFSDTDSFASGLHSIAAKFDASGNASEAPVPDFNSFKLALNVASADQRVLVLIAAPEDRLKTVERRLRSLAWDSRVQGRFHFDLESTASWKAPLSQKKDAKAGIFLISPDEFGLTGVVMDRLELAATPNAIMTAMARVNALYAKNTEKKIYGGHVQEGRAKGISIEMAVPFGEDRDADGEIDSGRSRRR